MRARDVMSKGVMSVASDASVHEAAALLVKTRVSAMPVVDSAGTMVGLVSEADLVRAFDSGSDGGLLRGFTGDGDAAGPTLALKNRKVTDVMTRDVAFVDADATLADIARLMLQRGVKRLPVVDEGAVVGIVSRTNLLEAAVSGDRAAWVGPRSGGWRR
ncbi:MAG: CBS domain-containing protein [Enhydrobacter sp.]|nr:MAG: CBS domain-containing protein [Enhydrobacter sp.]